MKLSRMLSIISILLNEEKVTAADLAQRFEVSVRTIVRDMQAINEAGFPIVSFQGYEGGYGFVEGYTLSKQLFHEQEIQTLHSVLSGMYNVIGDQSIRTLMDKLDVLSEETTDETLMIDLTPWGISEIEKSKLHQCQKAIKSHELIMMNYLDRNGNFTHRDIEPLSLVLKMSVWYLYGYCRERGDFRLFKVMRIQSITPTHQHFEPRDFNRSDLFADSSQNLIHLHLIADASLSHRVYDYFDPRQVTHLKDGSYDIHIDYPEDQWLYTMLLGFGGQLKIISPRHIRDNVILMAKNIIAQYDDESKGSF
jgi:predicted DNA-binding transcriptional regulator YafY